MPHVHLAQAASCVLAMPASANSLQRLASGACSDLLSLLVSATTAPIVVAPAMNDTMWNHRPVQRNVARIRDDGVYVIEPGLIFAASALAGGQPPMSGGPGTLWRGPLGVMQTLAAILDHHQADPRQQGRWSGESGGVDGRERDRGWSQAASDAVATSAISAMADGASPLEPDAVAPLATLICRCRAGRSP